MNIDLKDIKDSQIRERLTLMTDLQKYRVLLLTIDIFESYNLDTEPLMEIADMIWYKKLSKDDRNSFSKQKEEQTNA